MDDFKGTLGLIKTRTGLTVYPRAPVRIGTRMGRPEKAKEREMKPHVHVLFPVRTKGGPQRLVKKAASCKELTVQVGMRSCPECATVGFTYQCPSCGAHTIAPDPPRVGDRIISVGDILKDARERLGISPGGIPNMKGVQGLISAAKTPEPLEKGILRAKHGVSIFKDGTVRYDMTDVPLTHFRPREIGTSVEKLRELGYTHDVRGMPLTHEDQLLELKVQDIVPSKGFGKYMVGTARFVDDLLTRFYGLDPFYNVHGPDDLVGHLVIGLAPHTSGGVMGRVIGYTRASVGFTHPYFHAAKRRNCDGDEDCLMLVMDGLLNFSRSYLPSSRGGQMDAPLVLSIRLDPNEIDKEAHNIDVGWGYPLELYRAAQAGASPKAVEAHMETVGKRIGGVKQYEGLGFTHDTGDINSGPRASAYKTLDTMEDKTRAQLALASRLRAVDESDVANKVITSHFLPDMQGNLRSFTQQGARCTKCNAKYRRVPLRSSGKCVREKKEGGTCDGNLVLTVHEGGVVKYLDISKKITEEYDIPEYTRQRIALMEESINSTFKSDKVKTTKLSDFS
jgi:DNA polymerase II large subunit